MTVKMQHRRGTAAQWTAANPVLADGEMGIETDTGQVKCGNGTAAWNSLGYLSVALAAGIVNSTHLAASSVTSAKIADGSVTSAKIASGAVGSSQIADGAVATADLADGAVTSAKIADGAIVDGDIAAGAAIAASKIAGTAVVASLVDAKGDLLVATADNALTRLPVGSDG